MAGIKIRDDRQIMFLSYYLNPKSETYCNALQSALRAGFSRKYAENITSLMPDWLSESIGSRKRLLVKAEKNLEEHLDLDIRDKKINAGVLAIKHKASEFVAETVGKEVYSKKGDTPIQPTTNNFIQIVINKPNENTGDKSDSETISRVASLAKP